MPGWYIHLDVARKTLGSLAKNSGARALFAADGPTADELSAIARAHPAYAALGAIGPDLFFLLPDFKPPAGQMLWGAAEFVRNLYGWWDDNFLGPYQTELGPVAANAGAQLDALSGGVLGHISAISARGMAFLIESLMTAVVRQYDVFSLLGSGVGQGYDEQTFFWSDILHYRKTYQFAAYLWKKATAKVEAATDPEQRALLARHQAFALGWMTHLATDVTGHCFVNEKSGGPYRLHWQRHHLVENHMDAQVYDAENGGASIYNMLSCAALHLWVSFNPDGSSRVDFFDAQPAPSYRTDRSTGGVYDRTRIWDFDSEMPDPLADFISEALCEFYTDAGTGTALPDGQLAAHPTIIADEDPTHEGYVTPEKVGLTYWWLTKYLKQTTTDYYALLRPEQPTFITVPDFPTPPGAGRADPGPGAESDGAWPDVLEVLLAIFGWIVYLAQVVIWAITLLPDLIASGATFPVREALYEYVELPLYNAWQSLHWYLAMTGFVYPMKNEISAGLVTLGIGENDAWGSVLRQLQTLDGNLPMPTLGTEPSVAAPTAQGHPIDVVLDPPGVTGFAIDSVLRHASCGASERPSEFLRPWHWPDNNQRHQPVPVELPATIAGPYANGSDATALIHAQAGSAEARDSFERAGSAGETDRVAAALLPQGKHLGSPLDYTGYVVAWLTRNTLHSEANFNLDADRGYGYLCWDWVRSPDALATPDAWAQQEGIAPFTTSHHRVNQVPTEHWSAPAQHGPRAYRAPLRPGQGWCHQDLAEDNPPSVVLPEEHDEHRETPVLIRYLDREPK